jgi:hypothetical protein
VGKAQETLEGSKVTVTYRKDAAAYFIGDARVVKANVIPTSGVIHYSTSIRYVVYSCLVHGARGCRFAG